MTRVSAVVVLILLSACATAQLQPEVAPAERDAVLAAIAKDESKRTAMSADGTVLVRRRGVPVKGALTVAADASGRVRVDVATDAGNVMFAFACNGREVALLDFERRRFVRTPVGPSDLSAIGLTGMS